MIIEEYYNKSGMMPLLLKNKLKKLGNHPDISKEFEYWIKNKTYMKDSCISINGYTAEKLSELSEYLKGEGAFMLLIELRENPDLAMRKISEGFKIK